MSGPRIAAALLAATLTGPAAAQEGAFSAGSQAEEWSLVGEEKALFSARVVDILCEIAGDCPADCGAGARQLGLVRDADGALVAVLKNGQPLFNGAVDDLLPYCNAAVEVDGLLIGDDAANPAKFYQVQRIRRAGEAEWSKANRWTQAWAERNPEAATLPGPWFRKDPRVQALIAREGYLGLGLETDAAFIEYLFP